MPSFFAVERERENAWRKKKEGKKDKRKGKAPLGFNTVQQGGYLFFEAQKRTMRERKRIMLQKSPIRRAHREEAW